MYDYSLLLLIILRYSCENNETIQNSENNYLIFSQTVSSSCSYAAARLKGEFCHFDKTSASSSFNSIVPNRDCLVACMKQCCERIF